MSMRRSERFIFGILYLFTFSTFALSIIYVLCTAALGGTADTDYRLMLFQSCVGILSVNLPYLFSHGFAWRIPTLISSLYFLFLWGSIFLGEILHFYYLMPLWDDAMHFISAMLLGIFGLSLARLLDDRRDTSYEDAEATAEADSSLPPVKHHAFPRILIAVSFAMLIGAMWEIFEYLCDGILGINMQKFAAMENGELLPLVGRAALTDTMQDLIVDLLGAVSVATPGALFARRYPAILPSLTIDFTRKAAKAGK